MKYKTNKGSALVYSLIVAGLAGVLVLAASANVLTGSIVSSQNIDGIQSYYASESAMEVAYIARRLVGAQATTFPDNSVNSGSVVRATFDPMEDWPNLFTGNKDLDFTIVPDADNENISPNLDTVTMDFKIYPGIGDPIMEGNSTIANRSHLIWTNGYYGQSQYSQKTLIGGDPTSPILPYILSSLTP